MKYLLGIDDTDNQESRGTGHLSRMLGLALEQHKLGKLSSISRHQLLKHPEIPLTSHNSSACIEIESSDPHGIFNFCKQFLTEQAAGGSGPGLAMESHEKIGRDIKQWGRKCKKELVNTVEAMKTAATGPVRLEAITGTKNGIIGALAAIGLRASGNDGRFIWLEGLRNLKSGIFKAQELFAILDIDRIATFEGVEVSEDQQIWVGDWVRPVLINHKKSMIVEEVKDYELYQWETASRTFIRSIS